MPFLLFDRTYCKYVACMRLYTVFLHVELQVIALMMQLPILYEVFSPLPGWYKGGIFLGSIPDLLYKFGLRRSTIQEQQILILFYTFSCLLISVTMGTDRRNEGKAYAAR